MRRFGVGLVVAAAVLGAAAGCAGEAGGPGQPTGEPRIEPAWTSCRQEMPTSSEPAPGGAGDTATLPRLDDSFQPVAVVVCTRGLLRAPGGVAEPPTAERRAENVTALVAALRLPDEPRTDGPCTLELYLPPFFVLLDEQGRWARPGVPLDECGKPRAEVREALGGLRLTPAAAGPPESESAEAGCTPQWADMVWVTGISGTEGEPAVVPAGFDGPVRVRLCVYRVPADQQRTGKPAGEFVSGRYLAEDQWTGARREIESAPAAAACTNPASRFAVLHLGSGQLYAELDGCRRLLAYAADGGATLRQATPALLTLLTGR